MHTFRSGNEIICARLRRRCVEPSPDPVGVGQIDLIIGNTPILWGVRFHHATRCVIKPEEMPDFVRDDGRVHGDNVRDPIESFRALQERRTAREMVSLRPHCERDSVSSSQVNIDHAIRGLVDYVERHAETPGPEAQS